MYIDGRTLHNEQLEADLCIIGAGPAGIAIAHQFIDSGLSVIMVESGGLDPSPETAALTAGESTGFFTPVDTSRLRWFGGTTNHWEGMCAPLQPIDFEERHWIKHSGWPFSIGELLPYYKQASKFLNMSGTNSDDFRAPDDLIPHQGKLAFQLWRFPDKLLVGETYRKAFEKTTHIRVLLHTTIVNIAATPEASRITRLDAATLEGQRFTISAKRYVLACGGLENARMLLLARDQMPAGLGNQHDLVGRFFMQHPHMEGGILFAFSKKPLAQFIQKVGTFGKPLKNKPPHLYNITASEAAMRQHQMLNGSLTVSFMIPYRKPLPHPAVMMRHTFALEESPVFMAPIYIRCEQAPNRESRVMLSSNVQDPFGLPAVNLRWKFMEQDWLSIQRLVTLFSSVVSYNQYGVLRLNPWLRKSVTWPRELEGGYHHMGTTRMHKDPRSGVADQNCKVHGVDNLYIAGSSLFPTGGCSNPTYTLLALALRLARHLKSSTP